MPIDQTQNESQERQVRVEQLIEQYRITRDRRLMRRAKRLWKAAETAKYLAQFDQPADRIH